MPPQLHQSYRCQCTVPRPRMEMGQDSGLCEGCTFIYDENLYERRLRQYTPNYTFETVHDYLMSRDPYYKLQVEQAPV
jgi:hypothetical protein